MSYRLMSYLLILFFPVLISAQGEFTFPKKLDLSGFQGTVVETGNLFISGQPDSAAFVLLKEKGVEAVINLRTQREMDNKNFVPFNAKELVESLGMEYIHLPLGGTETPYTPEALENFAKALESVKGKALIHCTVAWRASHIFAAWLIKYKDFPAAKAIEYARGINFGDLPIEGLLNQKLLMDIK